MSDEFDVDEMLASQSAAREKDTESSALNETFKATPKEENPVWRWVKQLPRNISVGLMDAAVEAGNSIDDFAQAAISHATQDGKYPGPSEDPSWLRSHPKDLGDSWVADADRAVAAFREELAKESSVSDRVTQGVAQFAIPFLGWLKAFRVGQFTTLTGRVAGGLAAESAAVATSFDPQSGRMADLVELGRHNEGKLGSALRAISPDGSALNAYIDYMTDREDEGVAEGRFKNVIDNLAVSIPLTGLILAGGKALKLGRQRLTRDRTPELTLEAPPPVELPAPALDASPAEPFVAQPGVAFEGDAFRGVPAGVDPLDNASSYGNGLFYTPDETVAAAYGARGGSVTKRRLKFSNMLEAGNPADLNKKVGLPPEANLDDAVRKARELGYDGLTFDTGTGPSSREYVSLEPIRGAQ